MCVRIWVYLYRGVCVHVRVCWECRWVCRRVCTQEYLHKCRREGSPSVWLCVLWGVSAWVLAPTALCTSHYSSFSLAFPRWTTEMATALITQDGSEHSVGFPNISSLLRDASQGAQGEPCLGFRLANTLVSSSLPGTPCRQRQGVAASLDLLFWVPCPRLPSAWYTQDPNLGSSHQDRDSSSAIDFRT